MNGSAVPQSHRAARCVIWHPPAVWIDRELLDILARKGVQISARVDSEFAAFAQLAIDCRGIETQEVAASMLIVIEPSRLPSVNEVWRIIQRHGMRTVVWAFEAGASPRLHAFQPAPSSFEAAQPKPRTALGTTPPQGQIVPNPVSNVRVPLGPPKLRLASDEHEPASPEIRPPATSILSDAELAMLLSDDPPKR